MFLAAFCILDHHEILQIARALSFVNIYNYTQLVDAQSVMNS